MHDIRELKWESIGLILYPLHKILLAQRLLDTLETLFNPCPAEPGYTLLLQTV